MGDIGPEQAHYEVLPTAEPDCPIRRESIPRQPFVPPVPDTSARTADRASR